MKKVSNKVLSRAFGGKMFGSKTECERWVVDAVKSITHFG